MRVIDLDGNAALAFLADLAPLYATRAEVRIRAAEHQIGPVGATAAIVTALAGPNLGLLLAARTARVG